MRELSLNEIAKAVKGKIFNDRGDLKINAISTDTRKDIAGTLFIPIAGERFDGHMFIHMACEKGARCIISHRELNIEIPYIRVENTNRALMDLAEYYRSLFNIKTIAITGSIGKTTTKDMVASVLSKKYKTLKTEGNLNNEIGLPLMVFKLEEDTELAVFEMGMNQFGEIHNLSRIVKPDAALITNIGIAHIGNLGSREGIFKAKSEIFDFMKKDGTVILNGDDDMLKSLKDKGMNIYYFSKDNKEDFLYAKNIVSKGLKGSLCTFVKGDMEFDVEIPLPGAHMVYNALAAASAGFVFDLDIPQIQEGIREFELSKNRMDIRYLEKLTVINDVYNASPQSMLSMLEILEMAEGRKTAVLGDMLELGEKGEALHYQVGEQLADMNIENCVFIGALAGDMYKGFKEQSEKNNTQKHMYYFENKEDFIAKSDEIIKDKDTVLIKASRGMAFEKIVDFLLEK